MASLKKQARMTSSDSEQSKEVEADTVLDLSVAVGYLGTNVKKEEIDNLDRLIRDHCVAGMAALERGDTENHLHFQMVVHARTKSAKSFGVLVRKYMNLFNVRGMNPVGKVNCKVLTNRMIHTFKGMIGYCLKDTGSEHFLSCMYNISDDDVIAGKTLHAIYGRADLKRRVTLTNKNVADRMYVWHKYRCDRQLTATFLSTLTDMVQSGMFVPAASWIIPLNGQGMDPRRMTSLFKCITDPCNATKEDVQEIFVKRNQLVKGRSFDEDDVILEQECAADAEPDSNPPETSSPESEPKTPLPVRKSGVKVACLSREALSKIMFPVPHYLGEFDSPVKVEPQDPQRASALSKSFCGKRKLFEDDTPVDIPKKVVSLSDDLGEYIPLKDPLPMVSTDFLETTDSLSLVANAGLLFDKSKVKTEPGTSGSHHSDRLTGGESSIVGGDVCETELIVLSFDSEDEIPYRKRQWGPRKYVDAEGKPMNPPLSHYVEWRARSPLRVGPKGIDDIDTLDYAEYQTWLQKQNQFYSPAIID